MFGIGKAFGTSETLWIDERAFEIRKTGQPLWKWFLYQCETQFSDSKLFKKSIYHISIHGELF